MIDKLIKFDIFKNKAPLYFILSHKFLYAIDYRSFCIEILYICILLLKKNHMIFLQNKFQNVFIKNIEEYYYVIYYVINYNLIIEIVI